MADSAASLEENPRKDGNELGHGKRMAAVVAPRPWPEDRNLLGDANGQDAKKAAPDSPPQNRQGNCQEMRQLPSGLLCEMSSGLAFGFDFFRGGSGLGHGRVFESYLKSESKQDVDPLFCDTVTVFLCGFLFLQEGEGVLDGGNGVLDCILVEVV